MLEEAEKKEQERMAQVKNSSWVGTKKTTSQTPSETKTFKASPWAVSATKNEAPSGINFAPIQKSEQEKKMGGERKEQ